MAQVFISYSRKDLPFVERLAADLKRAGLDVWYDVSGIRGGSRWRYEIEKALRDSQFAVFVISPDSIVSEWVEREFLFASNRNLTLVPLLYRACELPLSFLNLNYIDVQGNNYHKNFNEILRALNQNVTDLPPAKTEKGFFSGLFPGEKRNGRMALFGLVLVVICIAIGSIVLPGNFPFVTSLGSTQTPTPTLISTTPVIPDLTDTPSPTPTFTAPLPPELSSDFWITYTIKNTGSYDIFSINPVTAAIRPEVSSRYHEKVGTWSPDGKILAYESAHDDPNFYQIYIYNGVGDPIKLTNYSKCSNWAPYWSPDGNKIVFYSNCYNNQDIKDEQRDIHIMDSKGRGRVNLTQDNSEDKFPAFSPDGKYITFTSNRDGRDQIFIMDVNGKNQTFIANGCSSTFSPLPDEYWLWFSEDCAKDGQIQKINIHERDSLTPIKISNVTDNQCLSGRNPVLSPDGNFVVFQSGSEICIMRSDGSNARPLTDGSAPSWKP